MPFTVLDVMDERDGTAPGPDRRLLFLCLLRPVPPIHSFSRGCQWVAAGAATHGVSSESPL